MKKIALLTIAAALMLTGCVITRQHTVDLSDPYAEPDPNTRLGPYAQIQTQNQPWSKASMHDINRRAQRRDAYVTLADARVVTAQKLQMTPDSTSWFEAERGLFEHIATNQIREVQFVTSGFGTGKGLLVGFLGGAALGAVMGYSGGDGCSTIDYSMTNSMTDSAWPICFSAEEGAAIVAVTFGISIGVVGAILGASSSQDIYRFKAPALPSPVIVEEVRQQTPKRE